MSSIRASPSFAHSCCSATCSANRATEAHSSPDDPFAASATKDSRPWIFSLRPSRGHEMRPRTGPACVAARNALPGLGGPGRVGQARVRLQLAPHDPRRGESDEQWRSKHAMPQAAAGPQGILLGKTNDQRAEHLRKLSLDVMAPQDVVHFLPGRREIECCTAALYGSAWARSGRRVRVHERERACVPVAQALKSSNAVLHRSPVALQPHSLMRKPCGCPHTHTPKVVKIVKLLKEKKNGVQSS